MAHLSGSRARGFLLAGVVLGSSLAFIDGSAVTLILPVVQQRLGGSLSAAQWIMNAYMLMLGALVLVGGAAADRYGRKAVFAVGVTLFAGASLACGLAPDLPLLIAARTVQGLGAALLTPASLALLGATFEGKARGQAVGVWAGASGLVAAAGPVLGGWLTDAISWRAVFFINLPVAAVALALVMPAVPESRGERRGRVDWLGAACVTLGLALLTWGLTEAGRGGPGLRAGAGVAVGLLALAGFVLLERRAEDPLVPLALFRSRAFSGLNGLTLLLYAAFSGALFVLPFQLIRAHGFSPAAAGAALLPLSVGLAVLSPVSGRLARVLGPRSMLTVGPLLVAAGFGLLAWGAGQGGYWTGVFPGLVLQALGMGVAVAPLTDAVLSAVPAEREGAASGINNAVARIGGLLAVALMGFALGGTDPDAVAAGYRAAMIAAAGGAAGAGLVGLLTAPRR